MLNYNQKGVYKLKKGLLITLLVVIVALGASGITYLIMDKNSTTPETPTNQPTEVKEQIKRVETVKNGEKIVQKYEIQMNGKTVPVNVEFTKRLEVLDEQYEIIEGSINNKQIYLDYTYTYKNENDKDYEEAINFLPNTIDREFTINNFKIIKGTDNKDYLVAYGLIDFNFDAEVPSKLYVFNDKMELLQFPKNEDSKFCTPDGGEYINIDKANLVTKEDIWYENTFGLRNARRVTTKIVDNKIYQLTQIMKVLPEENDYGTIEERVYTINNNKLEYTVANTYKAIDGAGQVC